MEGKSFWIIGAGKFGQRAARKLREKHPNGKMIMVDRAPATLDDRTTAELRSLKAELVTADGIEYLVEHLTPNRGPDWVIPSIPVHVAAEWVKMKLKGIRKVEPFPVPQFLETILPHPFRGKEGQLYLSHADFRCPADCPEPPNICTHTGKSRPGILFQELGDLDLPGFTALAIRSRQLAPGLGGYKPAALWDALEKVSGAQGKILFSTACRCHGVLDAFALPG